MKRHLTVLVVLLLASLPGFGSHSQPGVSSQFKLKPTHPFDSVKHRTQTGEAGARPASPHAFPPFVGGSRNAPFQYRSPKTRRPSSQPGAATAGGLVSATQIPMGGEDDDSSAAVIGDFNGDGKLDAAKLVYNVVGQSTNYSISVILSNGDGTFQAAVLSAAPNNVDDPIIVGDVNGDGKDDIIMVHPSAGGCDAKAREAKAPTTFGCGATFDVLLSNGDGTFTLGNNYFASGFGLSGGLLTDINGDGKLDVVVIDSESPSLVIELLGNGDGTFQTAITYATLSGVAPNNINFADFNGDGKLDFEGESGGQVMVYLNSGAGFAVPVALATSDAVYDSCGESTGDLNGDAIPEVVSVNCSDNTITVYVNNGDGSFQTGVYYDNAFDTYVYPSPAAIGDMNDDGNNDIVVGNSYGGSMTVFLGNGDGTVSVPIVGFDSGGYPWTQPLIADFNGDGLMDVIEPDDWFSFVYLEGYGDGTFRAAPSYGLPNSFIEYAYTFSVAAGDFNGDGFADVVAGQDGNTVSPGVAVYLANSNGTLNPPVTYGTSSSLDYVTVADLNGDGKLDIAATDFNAGVVQILLGVGDGTFTLGQTYPTDTVSGPEPEYVVAGDFNHDGKMDLAILNASSWTVAILLGNGDGTFGAPTTYVASAQPKSLATADLNGDGYLDLAVTFNNGTGNLVGVFLNNHDNTGTFGTEADVATGTGDATDLAFADLNGDGKLDMAVTVISGPVYLGSVVVTLGNGDGTFQSPVTYASSTQGGGFGDFNVNSVQIVDMNSDGNLDLAYLNYDYGTVGVMLGAGDGTFGVPVEYPTSGYAWGMAVADVNGDGSVDVVTGNDFVGGVSVLLNGIGTGTQVNYMFTTQTPTATVTAGSSAAYNLTAAGQNGYNGTITFSCTSGLPTGTACTFSPASVVAQGNLPFSTTMTITTTAAGTALAGRVHRNHNPNPNSSIFLALVSSMGLFGLVLGYGKKGLRRHILLAGMLLLMAITLVGCGNDCDGDDSACGTAMSTGTPPGTYTITVTSTGTGTAAPTHSVTETLVVQ